MVTKRSKRKRERVSAQRRVAEHKVGGGGSKYLTLPDGFEFFTPKAERYRLDFMSFRVGENNPYADKGNAHYERTFWIHREIGPNNEWHLCSAKTLGKPCPICEFRANMARDPDADENTIKALSPKERQLFLVVNLDNPDATLLWEYSFHLFGDSLDKKIKYADEEDEYEYFADPEEGKIVRVHFAASDKGKWLDVTDLEFRDRRKQYDSDKIDEMPCLDDLLTATPYDELKALFLQIEPEDEDEEEEKSEKKTKKSKKKDTPTADDFDLEVGDVVGLKSDQGGDYEIIKISKDGTSLTLEDEEGDTIKAVGADEVALISESKEKDEDEDEDEKPKARKAKSSAKKAKSNAKNKVVKKEEEEEEDDDDDFYDDDDDEENWDDDEDDD